ncbi:MAG: hypothetical protein V3W41_10035 [Planctomycetota bacterium]
MRDLGIYALVALLTTTLSAFVFYFVADASAAEDDAIEAGAGFSHDAVRAEVDDYFDEFVAQRLATDDSKAGLFVGQIQNGIDDIRSGQGKLLARLDQVANADPRAMAAADYVIPDADKIEAIVAQVLAQEEERRQRERTAKRDKDRKERGERRRASTMKDLKKRLKLDSGQESRVSVVMAEMEKVRGDMFTRMRDARTNGGADFDWRSMRTEFEKIGTQTDDRVKDILTTDQQKLYDAYKSENPWGGFGGGRRRGGNNRQQARGGRRGGSDA